MSASEWRSTWRRSGGLWWAGVGLLVAVTLLGGCGGEGDEETDGPTSESEETAGSGSEIDEQAAEELVTSFWAAMAEADYDAACDFLTPDAVGDFSATGEIPTDDCPAFFTTLEERRAEDETDSREEYAAARISRDGVTVSEENVSVRGVLDEGTAGVLTVTYQVVDIDGDLMIDDQERRVV